MIPATLQQSVLVQLFNFLFNGRMLNREKQIKIFLLNISFHTRSMRGLQHDIHICTQGENTKSLYILYYNRQIGSIQSYKNGNHKQTTDDDCIINCHPWNIQCNNKVIKVF